MSRLDVASTAWLLLLLAALAAVSGSAARHTEPGAAALRDASGHELALRPYHRIASTSLLADELLLELAEPERIVAFSGYAKPGHPDHHRLASRLTLAGPSDLERMLAARIDLLLASHRGSESELARARQAGIAVFDLGELRGLASLKRNAIAIATLLGDASRGEQLWQHFERRMRAVASDIRPERRQRAMFLVSFGGKLFGGTRGTSYHDVLEAAGLIDIAAERHRDWPQYDPEQVLELDAPWIVTTTGMRAALCSDAWLGQSQACRNGRVVEIQAALLDDPGLRMLDAAEALRDQVY
ncbi:MAG TPA: ABC transporter substrate-binding protein [Polyangiales bacterium]|nr:ABC transporter substrate-binding protein [Polyangiales bacterium]